VRCGKGTYVRTLAASLGALVGVPAHLEALRRTAAGPFTLAGALPLAEAEALARIDLAALQARIVPPAQALAFLPAVQVDAAEADALAHGRALARRAPAPLCRALDATGRLLAVCAPDASGDRLAPVRVLGPARAPGPARAGADRRRR
jgi:tRNA pseudouridine55 synthase